MSGALVVYGLYRQQRSGYWQVLACASRLSFVTASPSLPSSFASGLQVKVCSVEVVITKRRDLSHGSPSRSNRVAKRTYPSEILTNTATPARSQWAGRIVSNTDCFGDLFILQMVPGSLLLSEPFVMRRVSTIDYRSPSIKST